MINSRATNLFSRHCLRSGRVIGMGMLLAVALPAKATFILATNNMADQATFLNLINADTEGGTWGLNDTNGLVFTDNANVQDNNYANQLNALNNVNNARTIIAMQNAPGVLVGAFGPTYGPAPLPQGTQLIDLGDIQAFSVNGANQVQPLLDTRGSVLLHELAELNNDGGAANVGNAHNAGILMENNILASQGVLGVRLAGGGNTTVTAPAQGANFATFVARVPFRTTAAIQAAGGQAALANGARYDVRVDGTITPPGPLFNWNITNIARGLIDTGYTYDGTGYDVRIESVTVEAVPEPSTFALLSIGFTGLLLGRGAICRRSLL